MHMNYKKDSTYLPTLNVEVDDVVLLLVQVVEQNSGSSGDVEFFVRLVIERVCDCDMRGGSLVAKSDSE